MVVSKTDYILWRECPHSAWLKKHRPEVYAKYAEGVISEFERNLIEAGNEVEEYVRQRYPGGVLIERRGEEGLAGTREQLRMGANIIYQAAFSDGVLFSAVDIGASPKKLRDLLDRNILRIEDIPADEEFSSEAQQRQVIVHQEGRPLVDADAIRDALRELVLPLYFLDYETFNPAIPRFDG